MVVALPAVVVAQGTTWTKSTIQKYNGYDYELWMQNDKGNVTMKLTGDDGTSANAVGGTFEAQWSNTINVLFRSGRKFTNGNTSGTSGQNHKQIGNMSINFAATWSSTDNVKMLGVYGWAFFTSASIPTKQENGTSSTFSNQIEYYIIQDRGSWNPATGGTNSKKYGEGTIDGIVYEYYVCDRLNQPMLTGNGNFKQYFSVPKSTSSHRQSGTISVSKHFEEWERVGMKMDGPLYEVAMKVESYTGEGGNANGSAKVTKNILTIGADGNFTLTTNASPAGGGTITQEPTGTSFTPGAPVTLTPNAKSGYAFSGWSGDASGTANPLTVTMDKSKIITANFTMTADDTTNLIKDGKFPGSGLTTNWTLNQGQYYGNSEASDSVSGGKAAINVTKIGADPWNPQLIQAGIPIDSGVNYRLTFDAQASVARDLQVLLQRPDSPYTTYADKVVNLTTESQTVTLEFKMGYASNANGQLAFNLGQATGTVTLSNVRLIRIVNLSPTDTTGQDTTTSIARNRRAVAAKPTLRASAVSSGVKVTFKAVENGTATLRLYSLKGDVMATANLQTVSGKSYAHTLKTGSKLPSGFYMVGLQRGNSGAVERMAVLVR